MLTLIDFVNYFDRQVVFPLFEFLKVDFSLSDFQLGLIGTVFMIVHAFASVPLGILCDKWIRKNIIAIGIGIWSFATFLSGLAQNFLQLLITRGIVGIGEASYVPAATSLIADNFPKERRAKASSIFHLGMFTGGTLGMVAAGILGTHFGWRACFLIVALPGLVLAYTIMRIKEDKQHHEAVADVNTKNILQLFKNPQYLFTLIGGTFLVFTSGAIIAWVSQFFVRYHNYTVEQASITIGMIILIGGPLGIYTGGLLADWLYNNKNLPHSFVIAIAFLISTPLMYITVTTSDNTLMLISMFLSSFFMTWYYGPMVALIQDIVPSNLKATAFAMYLFFVHIFGDTPAPSVIGKISDMSNLQTAMLLPVAANFIGALFFIYTTRLIWKSNKTEMIVSTV